MYMYKTDINIIYTCTNVSVCIYISHPIPAFLKFAIWGQ